MGANFKCPKTGKEFTFSEYKIKFTSEGKIYTDKHGNRLINPDNGEVLEDIPKNNGFATAVHGSKSEQYQKMQNHLKQRSKDHYQKDVKYNKRAAGDLLGDTSKIK